MKVLVLNIFGTGHINPTLPLVSSLVKRGDQIIYYTTPERRAVVEKTGAEFRNYGRDDYKASEYNPGKNFVLSTLPAAMGLLPYLKSEVERERPDLILYDSMAPWGKILSHIYGIPSVCLVTTMALSQIEKEKMLKAHGVEADELNLKILSQLKNEMGLDINFPEVLGAYNDCNLVFTSRDFNPPLDELNLQHFHFIGASRLKSHGSMPIIESGKVKKKVITMALGTLLPDEDPGVVEWYKCVLKAFAGDRRYQVILATGNESIKNALGPLSPNVWAQPSIAQTEVLKMTDVFIHHGGMNSISEGIAAGVPMLIIPHSKDQFNNAHRVKELGVGLELRSEDLKVESLRSQVLDLMFSPTIKSRVKKFSEEFCAQKLKMDPLQIIMERVS